MSEPTESARDVLVVGAGLSGLACARALADAGLQVTVVEKSRGVGGRSATRRQDGLRFDHGAQYFTAQDPLFRDYVETARAAGWLAPWPGRVVTLERGTASDTAPCQRWVGTPGMSAVAKHLARALDLRLGQRVTSLQQTEMGWRAEIDGAEPIDALRCVLSTPAPQACALLPPGNLLAGRLRQVVLNPCVALMVAFERPLAVAFDGAFVSGSSVLAWIARDASKPGRPPGEQWVLHASEDWSLEHLEAEPPALAEPLLEALAEAVGTGLPRTRLEQVHRWRFARVVDPLEPDHLFDPARGLGYCGDACAGSRIEDVFLSGVALAKAMLRHA